tara:strand:+ start:325 stop:705 length:381 start_codon:yes stop_codon:yes gene_type:complete
MSKFTKLLIVVFLFGLGSQLLGQDVYDTPEEYDREITKQEQREKRSDIIQQKIARQKMADFRKYEAAHKRAHMRMKHEIKKPNRKHKILSYVIVGGVSFWVGHETAKTHRKKDKFNKRWDYKGDKK